jgi:hypothetical protein
MNIAPVNAVATRAFVENEVAGDTDLAVKIGLRREAGYSRP